MSTVLMPEQDHTEAQPRRHMSRRAAIGLALTGAGLAVTAVLQATEARRGRRRNKNRKSETSISVPGQPGQPGTPGTVTAGQPGGIAK